MEKEKKYSICFAYFVDGKFVGWYSDSSGTVAKYPKLYSSLDSMREIIQRNLTYKMHKINTSSFNEESKTVKGLAALSLMIFGGEEVLRGKDVELRVVKCPVYDGPNPDFDKVAYEALVAEHHKLFDESGIKDIPGPSKERFDAVSKFNEENPFPKSNNWIYADYKDLRPWADVTPTEFIEVIKPGIYEKPEIHS